MTTISKTMLVFIALILTACGGGGGDDSVKGTTTMNTKKFDKIPAPVYTAKGDKLPAMQELLEDLAICVEAPTAAQFVYGDNLAGYYEGYAYNYKKGTGYMMGKSVVYQDFASYAGGEILNKRAASLTKIYPYGVRTLYGADIWDEFALYPRQAALSIAVHSDKKQKLALFPMFAMQNSVSVMETAGGAVVISPKKTNGLTYPAFVALASDKQFDFKATDADKNPEMVDVTKHLKTMVWPLFTTKGDETDFQLTVAFGYTKDEAIANAKKLVKEAYIETHKQKVYDFLKKSYLWTDNMYYNRALMWAKLSSYFLVTEEFGKGIWAGLPWFKDNWGRDTFISIPGTLFVSGEFEEGKAVMTNFSTFQNLGNLVMTVTYPNQATMNLAKDYIKTNFGPRIGYKDNKIAVSIISYYITHQDELKEKIEAFKAAVKGVGVSYSVEINKEYGRIPNRVAGFDNIIYNTTDGTPWFIREMLEYLQYTGDTAFASEIYPVIKVAMEGAISNYVDKEGFLTHDDADTWMDARINGGKPWSARGNRANDIQVLWHNALKTAAMLATMNGDDENAEKWNGIADNLKANFLTRFCDAGKSVMADRVRADNSADYKVRPNQLMLISVPLIERFIPNDVEAKVVKNAVSELLYPYGIASLSQNDPYFHPYHDGQMNYNKDAAYHNGTVWGWNAGFTVSALARYGYTELAYHLETNLAYQILDMGCRGGMSELVDALPQKNGQIKLSGTYHQAWSVAEYSRNGLQDFGGFRPNLLNNEITLMPAIPDEWNAYASAFAFGMEGGQFKVDMKRNKGLLEFTLSYSGYANDLAVTFIATTADKAKYKIALTMSPDSPQTLVIDPVKKTYKLGEDSGELSDLYLESYEATIGALQFQTPKLLDTVMSIKEKDWLKKVIESGNFK